MSDKTVGILGGMGPEATIDLMHRIVAMTVATGAVKDDADHIRCIVDNNPKVPSRIKALIEGNGESPGPCMADMGKRLETWGADFLCIACNTAHNYLPDVRESVHIPVLDMVRLTAEATAQKYPGATVGLLASPAIRLTKIYEPACSEFGLTPLYAEGEWEARMLTVIRRIKAGDTGQETRQDFDAIVAHLRDQGASVQIVACTELSVLGSSVDTPFVDAADVLAQAVVAMAKGTKPLP